VTASQSERPTCALVLASEPISVAEIARSRFYGIGASVKVPWDLSVIPNPA